MLCLSSSSCLSSLAANTTSLSMSPSLSALSLQLFFRCGTFLQGQRPVIEFTRNLLSLSLSFWYPFNDAEDTVQFLPQPIPATAVFISISNFLCLLLTFESGSRLSGEIEDQKET